MTTVPPPTDFDYDRELTTHLKSTSAYYATHPRTPAGPERSDLVHPTRSDVCQGPATTHIFCGGEYPTPTGDTTCTCFCH